MKARLQPGIGGTSLVLNPIRDLRDLSYQEKFPEEITTFTSLSWLILNNMKYTEVPSEIGNLTNLTKLNLRSNKLTSLPESIGQLTKLKVLNLGNNQLTTLPESIKNCKSLKTIMLKGNNISDSEMAKIVSWLPANCKIK